MEDVFVYLGAVMTGWDVDVKFHHRKGVQLL